MEITTKVLTINGQPIKIHAISTGLVAVKQSMLVAKNPGTLAVLSSFLDRNFSEWMPIFVWVIEHPEGVFVIDTGENADINNKDYFKSSGWFENWMNTTQFKFKVSREEEIDVQLKKIGIDPQKVDKVILTHLHLDHIDGLRHFPNSEILVNQLEWEKPYGDLPKLYPDWLDPTLIPLTQTYENFDKTAFVTKDENLIMIQTTGHTYGHTSLMLKTDQGYVFFAGDVVYNLEQLTQNKYSAVQVDKKASIQNYENIKAFAKQQKLVLLPSHEFAAVDRLVNMEGI